MKAIIMSVQPQWLQKILIGKKKIEIRKTIPKCNLPIDVYLYCTQKKVNGENLYIQFDYNQFRDDAWDYPYFDTKPGGAGADYLANGKVVAKFTLNKVEEVLTNHHIDGEQYDRVVKESCMDYELFEKYVGEKEQVYAWHIDNLVIFDTPKPLDDFKYIKIRTVWYSGRSKPIMYRYSVLCSLTKAPQSWQYIEVKGG